MSLRSLVLLIAIVIAACGSSSGDAQAFTCDLYAAPSGSGSASGSAEHPLASPQQLADRLRPGQTGCLRDGTYARQEAGGYVLKFFHGGDAGRRLTIRSAPGERARRTGVVYFPKEAPHVALRDVDVDGRAPWLRGNDPVTVQIMARDIVFAGNDVTNRGLKSCMIMGSNSGWGRAVGSSVTDNVFRDCGDTANGMLDHGIYVENTLRATIARNTFRGIPGYAVHLYPNAQRSRVRDNVMVGNGGGVIFAGEGPRASSGNLVERNVIAGSTGDYNISASWGGRVGRGNVARANCLAPGRVGNVESTAGFSATGNVSWSRAPQSVSAVDGNGCSGAARVASRLAHRG